jgi:hypothetical protein
LYVYGERSLTTGIVLTATKHEEASLSQLPLCPAPQQANAASAIDNVPINSTTAAARDAEAPISDHDLKFKIRTFDVFWVDKTALMYRDGIAKAQLNNPFVKQSTMHPICSRN